ncbi:hypothetical protein B0O99DRAFT_687095 [Bisporella sp. PMI_857]|jgi:hypothetical protein|nr:hypothetical protein B0O99DRAFT_687095 [Bisporella sp. PMI_857]
MGLFELLQQRIELFRLEQRYTRRRNRRSTFVSEAQYVDGEYVYSPNSSYSAKCTAGASTTEVPTSPVSDTSAASKETKLSRRMSKMGLDKMDWRKSISARQDKRQSRVNVREMQWHEDARS